ncbi:MAG: hypothetical protein ACTTKH_08435 [Treponema sp.]
MKNDDLFVEMEESYQGIDLRYSRERRLKDAPEAVKLMHSPDYIKRQSCFASIWHNRGHRFIFIAILILSALNIGLFLYYYSSSSGKISGVKVEIDTFQYGSDLLINLVFYENKNKVNIEKNVKAYTKAFNAKGEEVSFLETQGIYIGSKLILHFKMENKGIKKIEAIILMDEKVLSLSKRI